MEQINFPLPVENDRSLDPYYSLLGDLKSLKSVLRCIEVGAEIPLTGCEYYALKRINQRVNDYMELMEGIKCSKEK